MSNIYITATQKTSDSHSYRHVAPYCSSKVNRKPLHVFKNSNHSCFEWPMSPDFTCFILISTKLKPNLYGNNNVIRIIVSLMICYIKCRTCIQCSIILSHAASIYMYASQCRQSKAEFVDPENRRKPSNVMLVQHFILENKHRKQIFSNC